MIAMPATLLTAIVSILAILFYFYTGWQVGSMRGKHNIKAPAVTGHPEFECAYRVQMNTLEHFVIFLPLLWLATAYFRTWAWLPALVGLIWIIGRILYMTGYMAAPEKRSTGFLIAAIALLALLILAIVGIVQDWVAVTTT
jgi:glutathione S-transferase